MSGVNRALAIPIALGLCGLAACIAIPIPVDHTTGRAVDPKTAIEVGVTTKEEVLARLGEPDNRFFWESERVFVYSWEHANWLWLWAGNPGAGANYSYADQMLLIQFDASGRVARAERVERPSGKSYAEFIAEWGAKGRAHANP